jgi:HEAT repeat protein
MRVLESRSEDTVKVSAAQALAVVGDQSYVPKIQQLLKKESDSTVKENLTLAIQVLSEYGR